MIVRYVCLTKKDKGLMVSLSPFPPFPSPRRWPSRRRRPPPRPPSPRAGRPPLLPAPSHRSHSPSSLRAPRGAPRSFDGWTAQLPQTSPPRPGAPTVTWSGIRRRRAWSWSSGPRQGATRCLPNPPHRCLAAATSAAVNPVETTAAAWPSNHLASPRQNQLWLFQVPSPSSWPGTRAHRATARSQGSDPAKMAATSPVYRRQRLTKDGNWRYAATMSGPGREGAPTHRPRGGTPSQRTSTASAGTASPLTTLRKIVGKHAVACAAMVQPTWHVTANGPGPRRRDSAPTNQRGPAASSGCAGEIPHPRLKPPVRHRPRRHLPRSAAGRRGSLWMAVASGLKSHMIRLLMNYCRATLTHGRLPNSASSTAQRKSTRRRHASVGH